MQAPQRLLVIAATLLFTSCTAYLQHDAPYPRHAGDAEQPTMHAGRKGVVGLSIGRSENVTRAPIVVQDVVPGSPAADANIRPGDRIRAIDGRSTSKMTVSEAAGLIRGRVGTPVELRLESPRGSRLITLIRAGARRPCHAGRPGRRHGDGAPCDHCGAGRPCHHRAPEYAAPPPAAPPAAADQSLEPQEWPPTKPGHRP